ncbi:hypothetical protein [Sinorhizobium fredii]|uniref:hypothetical protein n=1 Tax=Rhizobium fredii TaxID=380 RepID=UPI0004BBC68B|nr:hypothetical protein [Sinorhizobium fredii]AWI60353.1 hypothetical protein AB395_00005176 [Sinorhizobium fredii CCBAU 45436]
MINQDILDKAYTAERLMNSADYKDVCRWVEEDIFALFNKVPLGHDETLKEVQQLSHGFKLFKERIAKYIEIARYEAQLEASNDEEY